MNRLRFIATLTILAIIATAVCVAQERGAVELTYIANQGFLIQGAGKRILVDALFRDDIGYAPPAAETLRQLEGAAAPFDELTIVLATHFHRDHFSAASVAAHLRRNPKATFVSVRQATDLLAKEWPAGSQESARILSSTPAPNQKARVTVDGVPIDVMRLKHGNWENTAFLIHLGGKKILHLGDSDGEISNFDAFDLEKEQIDVAMVPYWYFLYDEGMQVLREHIRARQVIAFHIPADTSTDARVAAHMTKSGGQTGIRAKIQAALPGAIAATDPGRRWTF